MMPPFVIDHADGGIGGKPRKMKAGTLGRYRVPSIAQNEQGAQTRQAIRLKSIDEVKFGLEIGSAVNCLERLRLDTAFAIGGEITRDQPDGRIQLVQP